jgi:hypothetical protein
VRKRRLIVILYYDRQSILVLGRRLIFPILSLIIFFDSFSFVDVGAPSLTRRRVCTFQFLLGIASTAFLRSESHGTDEHILLSLILRPHT